MDRIFFVFFISLLLGSQVPKLTPYQEIIKVLDDDDLNELDKFVAKYNSPDSILMQTVDGATVTILMTAQFKSKFKHSERLIELKADVDFAPWIKRGCPLYSSMKIQPEIAIRYLLENCATIYTPLPIDDNYSIFSAIMELKLSLELVEEFLRLGADPNYIDISQNLPECIVSAVKHSDECLDLLINHGADINCFNEYTALHSAVFEVPDRAISSLFKRDFRADVRGENGRLPIYFLSEQRKQLENRELMRKAFLTAPFRTMLKSIDSVVKYQTYPKTLIMQYFDIFFVTITDSIELSEGIIGSLTPLNHLVCARILSKCIETLCIYDIISEIIFRYQVANYGIVRFIVDYILDFRSSELLRKPRFQGCLRLPDEWVPYDLYDRPRYRYEQDLAIIGTRKILNLIFRQHCSGRRTVTEVEKQYIIHTLFPQIENIVPKHYL